MKNFYSLLFIVGIFAYSVQTYATRVVHVAATTGIVDISDIILNDVDASGNRIDSTTVYKLENGGTYGISTVLANKGWTLHIEAEDLDDTDNKPYITRIPNDSGSYPGFINTYGNVILKNLWLVIGEQGALQAGAWGAWKLMADSARIQVSECIMEKDFGGLIQVRANGGKIYIENSILRNANSGNRFMFEGNGRAIDSRTYAMDTVVVKNCVIHNIADRVFRSLGNVAPNNYIEFDHVTLFNHMGRHGCFVFEKVLTGKVTNCLLINPIMQGTSPRYCDEQHTPDHTSLKVFTVDTLYENTKFDISNNDIFWTDDVKEYWASQANNDTIPLSQPGIYSKLIAQRMGADTTNSYIQEVVKLDSVPESYSKLILPQWIPNHTMDKDEIVEDLSLAGTEYDGGNLFDFSQFNPCFDSEGAAASYATNGGHIGATFFCNYHSTGVSPVVSSLNFKAWPNPATTEVTFSYMLNKTGTVALKIFDINGRLVNTLVSEKQNAGSNSIVWNIDKNCTSGLYLAKLITEDGGVRTIKITTCN